MAGKGTAHHRLKGLTGLIMIIGLLPVLNWAMGAIPGGTMGFTSWLSAPIPAIFFLVFFTAAIWYCKLEFDEVIMDYFDGGLRSFSLLTSKVVAFLAWAAAVFAVVRLAFLG